MKISHADIKSPSSELQKQLILSSAVEFYSNQMVTSRLIDGLFHKESS